MDPAAHLSGPDAPQTAVLFNADCPVCSLEIRHYAAYAAKTGLPIRFDDLNSDALACWGVTADRAARRLHVLHQGRMVAGLPAFLVLWAQMPRYRGLARLVGLPGVRQVAGLAYDLVLAPALYHWHRWRRRRRSAR